MILFVFEGEKTEPNLFKTLEHLYFTRKNERKIYCFGYNIYELYRLMRESDFEGDVVSVIRDRLSDCPDNPLKDLEDVADISEIYLFFDYDFQNKNLSVAEMNCQVKDLLRFFNDESENTRLYIHYPMVESIKCTNELPDKDFINYTATRDECHDFKHFVTQHFSFYGSSDFYEFSRSKETGELRSVTPEKEAKIRQNWEYLKIQNLLKAHYICTGNYAIPTKKNDISQKLIFEKQIEKYIEPKNSVAILNAFPLFLYEYFKM